MIVHFFFFQAEDGIRDLIVTGVQTCALPISTRVHARLGHARAAGSADRCDLRGRRGRRDPADRSRTARSEEHTSELQSRSDLVCRLLLEKKKKKRKAM